MDTARTLQVLQFDAHAKLGFSSLLQACRQTYHELHVLSASKRVFTVSALKQHCLRPECHHYRFRIPGPANEFKEHSYTNKIGKDGMPIFPDNNSSLRGSSDYELRSTRWYARQRCTQCEKTGMRVLALHETQLADIKRLAVPFCMCYDYRPGHNGHKIHGILPGVFNELDCLGLQPQEIFLQCCICAEIGNPNSDRYNHSPQIYPLIRFIERLVEKFPSLKKIILYYCHRTRGTRRPNVSFQVPSANVAFHKKVVERISSHLRMPRVYVKKHQYWARKNISSEDDSEDQGPEEKLVYERIKEPRKGQVELEFYNSEAVAGKYCVFDSKMPEERGAVPPSQLRQQVPTGDWARTARGGWILNPQPVMPPTPVISGIIKEPESSWFGI